MITSEIGLLVILSFLLFSIIAVVLLIIFWFRSSSREKNMKIKELQKEIEELKREND